MGHCFILYGNVCFLHQKHNKRCIDYKANLINKSITFCHKIFQFVGSYEVLAWLGSIKWSFIKCWFFSKIIRSIGTYKILMILKTRCVMRHFNDLWVFNYSMPIYIHLIVCIKRKSQYTSHQRNVNRSDLNNSKF